MLKMERATRRRNCGFCDGEMRADDFQIVENLGATRKTWCLRCGRLRIEDQKRELGLLMVELDKETKKNPDRYVLTAMTGK